ncbi:MAG TPA: hypothetical protein EYP36_04360, partial [Calditrichaeota bacterium]|nr:hypothetical protein [Calditrichota bacterium]
MNTSNAHFNIRPASQSQIKLWRKLQLKKYREQEGLYLVSGWRAVETFLFSAKQIVEAIIVSDEQRPNL